MKILVINASPRGKSGMTYRMLAPLVKGMEKAGATIDSIELGSLNIHHCVGCFSCWTKTPGVCIFKDDVAKQLPKIIDAEIIVFGTPLYYYQMTGLLKNFLDRTIPLALPDMENSKEGLTQHLSRYPGLPKKYLLVSPAGFPEFEHFENLVAYFKFLADKDGASYLGEILRPAAGLMLVPDLKEVVSQYEANLEKAGEQLIKEGKIASDLHKALDQLWLDPETYRKIVSEKFKEMSN